jgi:hypothetical protein
MTMGVEAGFAQTALDSEATVGGGPNGAATYV